MESIGRYSAAIYRLSQSILNHKLRDLDISSGQHDFFLAISKREGMSQKELGEMLFVEKSTTAKAVRQLETRGYIYKKRIPNDKRFYALYLTEKGQNAALRIQSEFNEILNIFSEKLSEDTMNDTICVLKQVIRS